MIEDDCAITEDEQGLYLHRQKFEQRNPRNRTCDWNCADRLDEQLETVSVGQGRGSRSRLKDRFALCGSTVVATLIAQKLPSVLFLPRLAL